MYATRSFEFFFFGLFLFCFVALHSTPHGARPLSAKGALETTHFHSSSTTQRGGGCVVAQGGGMFVCWLPICLVGPGGAGKQNGSRNAKKSEKLERGTCVCVYVHVREILGMNTRYRYHLVLQHAFFFCCFVLFCLCFCWVEYSIEI